MCRGHLSSELCDKTGGEAADRQKIQALLKGRNQAGCRLVYVP